MNASTRFGLLLAVGIITAGASHGRAADMSDWIGTWGASAQPVWAPDFLPSPKVPPNFFNQTIRELATISIVHRIRAKDSLAYLRECNEGWNHVTIEELASLKVGEAYILSHEASDESFVVRPRKVRIRPSCAMPGGTTRTAVPSNTAA